MALETGSYECLPAPVFVRGFLRTLAKHLGLEADELLALYLAAVPQSVAPSAVPVPANGSPHLSAGNGHANGYTNGHTNGHTNGSANAYANGQSNGHTNGHTNGNANAYINGQSNGHTNGNANGHINGHSNGHAVAEPVAATPPPELKTHWKPVWARPAWLSGNVLMSGLIVLLLTVGVAWGGDQMLKGLGQSQPARALNALQPTIEAIVLEPTPTDDLALNPTPAATAVPTTPVSIFAASPTPLSAQHNLELKLDMPGRSWVRVDADGVTVFQAILEAGNSKTFTAKNRITMRAGNGAGVSVTVNGSAQGPLGASGDVVDKQWVLSDTGAVSSTPPVWSTPP